MNLHNKRRSKHSKFKPEPKKSKFTPIRTLLSFYKSKISKGEGLIQKLLFTALSLASLGLGVIVLIVFFLSLTLPNVKDPAVLMGAESTIFYDKNGQVLYTVSKDQVREEVAFDTIPQAVKDAMIAIEDDKFYEHDGIDLGGILKAVLSEFGIGKRRGGSTITQQLVKNSLLSSERTYSRKLKEIILAIKIERTFNKDEILTMYLNRIPFGGTAYGVEKAAEVFFGKTSEELGVKEAAILASLPKAPTYFSPFGNHKNTTLTKEFTEQELQERKVLKVTDLNQNEYSYGLLGNNVNLSNGVNLYLPGRTDEVLKRMEELDYITEEQRQEALNELQAIEFKRYLASIKAPHFVFYVKEILEKKYGREMVENGGLQVYTTLDLKTQQVAEKIVREQAVANKGLQANNAAMVSIDVKSGNVLAMVGSKDYFDEEIDGSVNMVTAKRQPGSSFKPIVYASAFQRGLNPSNYIFDVPIKLGQNTPKNFDGEFMGPISVKKALAQSRNIPAIKAYFVGGEQDEIISLTERLGIRSLDRRSDYGWPLSLGTGELQMLELAQSYSVFANQGKKIGINPILKILDRSGNTIEDYSQTEPSEVEVLDPEIVYLVNNSLSDKNIKLGRKMSLVDGRPVAAKTGTSTKKIGKTIYPSNLWMAGWTPDVVTIAWAGNSDGSKMNLSATGYSGATPIWYEFMNHIHEEKEEASQFVKPDSLKSVAISKLSGTLPSKGTPSAHYVTGDFIKKFIPTKIDQAFSESVVDSRNYKMPTKFCPPEYVKKMTFWDYRQAETYTPRLVADRQQEIKDWFLGLEPDQIRDLDIGEDVVVGQPFATASELCDPRLASNRLAVEIRNALNLQNLNYGKNRVFADVLSDAEIDRVEFKLNNKSHFIDREAPFEGDIRISSFLPLNSSHVISVKAYDANGYSAQTTLNVTVGNGSSPVNKPVLAPASEIIPALPDVQPERLLELIEVELKPADDLNRFFIDAN